MQIEADARDLAKYTKTRIVCLVGGIDYQKQKNLLRDGSVDILVATPGRLLDFCGQRLADLSRVEVLVIDEADRMLDMGFIPDVRRIVYQTPRKRSSPPDTFLQRHLQRRRDESRRTVDP